ncbi:hypothetical protein [Microbacterium sp. ZXX196]|uniref:hypothetical protein n=1 Tax=Microbacterium sp. ZXX196 TaxID=2609291 RepID=UPI0012B93B0F|nr:hypothetical protein [Microbacterium sp. ZXX196]MTE24220.1 hypothetical protein [Microbacterium sp. ZXX196]
MEWTSDVTAGSWIRERLDPDTWSIGLFVPRGFAAYARIFHPAFRERPVRGAWPEEGDTDGWERFLAERPEVDAERVSWADVARAFGTTPGPLVQWDHLVGTDPQAPESDLRDGAGWRYEAPEEGVLDPAALAAAARHLVAHTGTPGSGYAAIWEGWGGLLGFVGTHASRILAASAGDDAHHGEFLRESYRDAFNNVFRKGVWQPGVLSDEISRGPRLELPGRGHVLFRAAPAEWADPAWADNVPWAEPLHVHSPSLVWPDDRAWVLASEIDLDSTIVAGSEELIAALVADPGLEAHRIPEDADLTWPGR